LSEFYNFGGVKETRKGKGVRKKTKESYDGKTLTDTIDSFRQFDSLDDYVKYKIDLLGNSNYNVFAYRPDQLYNRLVTAKNKYATDPNYEKKLNSVYRTYLAV
jgi:flagellum-specific peptidoglycan hydrolase FlgJ